MRLLEALGAEGPVGTSHDFADTVVEVPDGRVVVAGASDDGSGLDFALASYNHDGRSTPPSEPAD